MKNFIYNIEIECEKDVTQNEISLMMHNIHARLQGYVTDNPDYLGEYKMNIKVNTDSIIKGDEEESK